MNQELAFSSIETVLAGADVAQMLSTPDLVLALERLNDAYRRGSPLVTDARYDSEFIAELRAREPNHPFLQLPEPEPDDVFGEGVERVKHEIPMLSTEKAYTQVDVDAWLKRALAAAKELGKKGEDLLISVKPKLDGISGMDSGGVLATRGKNGYGSNITRVLERGVVPIGGRGLGAGEVVIVQRFFEEHISGPYGLAHPRNFMAGLAGADEVQDYHQIALEAGVCRFVPYATLSAVTVNVETFQKTWEQLMDEVQKCIYLCDGVVAEFTDTDLKIALGSTSQSHRWQIALKKNSEFAETTVMSTRMTTGRTGRISPTLICSPVNFYGATVTKVTAHTANHLRELKLGKGARIQITRSGGVIPTYLKTLAPGEVDADFDHCPACNGPTEWDGPYLTCTSFATCQEQAARSLRHFFGTLGVCNGFGPAVTDKLVTGGIKQISDVYNMNAGDMIAVGISAGVAQNLVEELARSRRAPISDAIFLGAFGVRHLGRGDARHLLSSIKLCDLKDITVERLQAIKGFGTVTSPLIVSAIRKLWPTIEAMLALGFNLQETPLAAAAAAVDSPIAGKTLVFTGTMTGGAREDMEAEARKLGATVGSGVTSKTSYLVCGQNSGAGKTGKAASLGVQILTEAEYRQMLTGMKSDGQAQTANAQ